MDLELYEGSVYLSGPGVWKYLTKVCLINNRGANLELGQGLGRSW